MGIYLSSQMLSLEYMDQFDHIDIVPACPTIRSLVITIHHHEAQDAHFSENGLLSGTFTTLRMKRTVLYRFLRA